MNRRFRVARSIAGPVLLEFGDALNGFRIALTEESAIKLCDSIRRVIEQPTQMSPRGENVVIMDLADSMEVEG